MIEDVCYDVQMTGGSTLRITMRADYSVWAMTVGGPHGNRRVGNWEWDYRNERVRFQLRPSFNIMLAPEDLQNISDGYKTLLAKSVVE